MKRIALSLGLAVIVLAVGSGFAMAAAINQVAYGSLGGTAMITFDDVAGGTAPGTNYDAIFESNGADFGERFVGQTITASGDFDTISGLPSGSLALATGSLNHNLGVYNYSTNVMYGLGTSGFPQFNAIGEGSFAVLFDFDQSEFGFQLVGGNSGNAYVAFYGRGGSLIDTITVAGLAEGYYGFSRDGGINDIAGITIYNDDLAGIGFDNLKHDVAGVPGQVPEPSTMLLLGSGLVGLVGYGRRRFKK